jgi:hypothetical protein
LIDRFPFLSSTAICFDEQQAVTEKKKAASKKKKHNFLGRYAFPRASEKRNFLRKM